ncbi:extracellular solute-binding protein [Nocardioides sp. CCNWLW239]|uniref:sugar ABC transporter substrate-binding protein n=1 Tax=Nocardioides sp. CCNWLW239 TaxID=3128902 RepID=UPI00301AEA44
MLSAVAAGISAMDGIISGAKALGAVIAPIVALSPLVVWWWSRRRVVRARRLKVDWDVEREPGVVILNESKTTFERLVLTVSCGIRGRTARTDITLLQPNDPHRWPSEQVHQSPAFASHRTESERHDLSHHETSLTFRDGKRYWSREGAMLKRVDELVIWAEKTRAATLRQYFGRRSQFRRAFAVDVKVEAFDRTESLESAFARLAATGRPPSGRRVPDVIAGPHDWIGRVVRDEAIQLPPLSREGLGRVSPVAIDALSIDEDLYAIPYAFDSVALIRNNALAGDGPMPDLFDDVVRGGADALARAEIPDGRAVALQVGSPDAEGNAGDPFHMWPLFTSLGGSFFGLRRTPGDASLDDEFDDPSQWRDGFVNAFVRLAELGRGPGGSGVLQASLGRADALPMFLDGKAPYLVCSSRALAAITATGMQITVGAVPRAGELDAVSMVSVYGLYIYRDAPNLPAARDLLTTFLSEQRAGEELSRIQPLVPVQKAAMDSVARRDANLRPYVEACHDGLVMPSWGQMRRLWQILGRAEHDVLAGEGDPRQIAEAAADAGWEIITRS